MTSYTVTATNGTGSNGITLQVEVITGATEAGGASGNVSNGAGGPGTTFTVSVTPVSSGSFIAWAASEASAGYTAIAAAASNALLTVGVNGDTFEDTANGYTSGAGYYSGTVTASTPVTAGAGNAGVSSGGPQLAAYEIQPNPTWAEDASTPAWVKVTGSNVATTASFAPPAAGAVLVAICSANVSSTGAGNNITVASTPSLTWTLRSYNTSAASNGLVAIYTATVPSSLTSGPLLGLQSTARGPVTVPVFAGWRGAAHSR